MQRTALPELLCPAGDEAALRAAVDCGADAVYLGYKSFGARASAVNFDDGTLERSVRYAHLHHVRVHVTVNTLVKQDELSSVREALDALCRAGADAVIVQDLGVAAMVRRDFPSLALHASTQMALCNASGADFARRFGFSRVVLARECSLDDIRAAVQTGVEIEVFAHGALCSAVSGRCLMSSMAGGRSGNRGRCAQPCRQAFRLDDRRDALLSLRDLCLWDDLPALCGAGVRSLKIEGRLKSAEYVAVVTSAYRRALDAIAAGTFRPGDSAMREELLQIFNRGGFTRGHVMGAQDAALCAMERVGHEGVALGKVLRVKGGFAAVRLERALADGDSLQIRGSQDLDMRYSGHSVEAGGTATLRLRPDMRVCEGDSVARLSDALQLERARAHAPKPISVSMRARFEAGAPMRLFISDGQSVAEASGPSVERAQTRQATPEDARRQLEKLGDTPFLLARPEDLSIDMQDGLFLPVSALNALRRQAVERLAEARISAFAARAGETPARGPEFAGPLADGSDVPSGSPIGAQTLAVVFSDAALVDGLKARGANLLIYEPRFFTPEALEADLASLPGGIWLRLPPQLTERALGDALAVVARHEKTLGGLLLESAGQLALPLTLPVIAGEGVPITNREGLRALTRTRALGFTLWPEWTKSEQRAIMPFELPCLLTMYGRQTLMLLNHCPKRAVDGLSGGRGGCGLCTNGRMACGRENAGLTDRKGYRFPLYRTVFPEGCVLSVVGALPTDLHAYDADRRAMGAGMLLRFTVEPAERQLELTSAFAALLRGEPSAPPEKGPATSGHWLRGVE